VNCFTHPTREDRYRHHETHEEEAMSDLVARPHPAYSLLISSHFKVVCLFCLLGLALAAALIPMLAPEDLTWVLSHVE
jgi:hypothetical protein